MVIRFPLWLLLGTSQSLVCFYFYFYNNKIKPLIIVLKLRSMIDIAVRYSSWLGGKDNQKFFSLSPAQVLLPKLAQHQNISEQDYIHAFTAAKLPASS